MGKDSGQLKDFVFRQLNDFANWCKSQTAPVFEPPEEEDVEGHNRLTLKQGKGEDGKYRTFQEMYDSDSLNDESFCDWVIYKKVAPSGVLAAFKEFLEEEEGTRKAQDKIKGKKKWTDEGSNKNRKFSDIFEEDVKSDLFRKLLSSKSREERTDTEGQYLLYAAKREREAYHDTKRLFGESQCSGSAVFTKGGRYGGSQNIDKGKRFDWTMLNRQMFPQEKERWSFAHSSNDVRRFKVFMEDHHGLRFGMSSYRQM